MYQNKRDEFSDCEKCVKNSVCNLREEYEDKLLQLSGISTPGRFELTFKCLYYYEAPGVTRGEV